MEVIEAEIEITTLAENPESKNILLVGPSGHGKTVLAGGVITKTGPGLPQAVFISTEKGAVSARRAGSKARRIAAPTWEKVESAKHWCDANLGSDDWVIIDSLTKMQILMIRWILRMEHEANENRDLHIPAIQNYQKWYGYFKAFVDDLIDARYNVIFITTEMFRDDMDGETIVLPHIIGGKNDEVCNYVRAQTDINLYYAVSNKAVDLDDNGEPTGLPVRRLLAQPVNPYVFCKDRYSALGRYQDVYDGEYFAMAEFVDMMDAALKESQ